MTKKILDHYLEFSTFTDPGPYKSFLKKLPDDVQKTGNLVTHQVIHRVNLRLGNTWNNADLRYGDMDEFPWYRLRCEDEFYPTVVSLVAELLRRDKRGFVPNRAVEDKIVVTCRYVSIIMASILKLKGIPCRLRSGFGPYFLEQSMDHWLNQYWSKEQNRWVTFDVVAFFDDDIGFDPFDIPEEKFDWAGATWLGLRSGKLDPTHFVHAGGFQGLEPAMWAVIFDFHCLMNNEILYRQMPQFIFHRYHKLGETEFKEIDRLAELLLDPDENFDELLEFWETNRKFRILNSPLIGDDDHVSDWEPKNES